MFQHINCLATLPSRLISLPALRLDRSALGKARLWLGEIEHAPGYKALAEFSAHDLQLGSVVDAGFIARVGSEGEILLVFCECRLPHEGEQISP